MGRLYRAISGGKIGFGHQSAPVQVAANVHPAAAPAADGADVLAFGNALAAKGLDAATATRAMYANRRSQGMAAGAAALN